MGNGRFNQEFKEQVVLQVLSGEKKASQLAQEIGVHHTSIRDWVKTYQQHGPKNAFPGSGHGRGEEDELRKLRREMANLKEENEILKKAAAYFAKNLR